MVVGATILTGACTTTLTDSTGPESAGLSTAPNSSPAAAVLDDIGSFLIAAGCARTTVSDTGLIVLGFTSAAGERFDCAGVDPVARHAAYRSEVLANAARQALESGMAVALSGYYEWNVIDVQSVCTVYWGTFSITFPNSGEVDAFSPVDGVYVGTYYVEAGVPLRLDFYQDTPCTETMVSRGTFVPFDGGDGSGGDGGCCGGGPGGDAPPSSPPPPPEPLLGTCPDTDESCLVRPDTAQIRMMEEAWASRHVSVIELFDTTMKAQCDLAKSALGAIIGSLATNDGPIWVGQNSNEPPGYPFHLGQANPDLNRMHIDLEVFDSIKVSPNSTFYKSLLLSMLMHEALHLNPHRLVHPIADSINTGLRPPNPANPSNPYSYEQPFAAIFSPVPGQRCVKF